jgi:hypothetical protein
MHSTATSPAPTNRDDAHVDADTTFVIASRLRLRSVRHLPAFLRAAHRVDAQVRTAPGRVDSKLRAQPLRLTFWTLSSWQDEASMLEFVRSSPHAEIMRDLRDRGAMRSGDFRSWSVARGASLPSWDAVEARFSPSAEG